jgi:hypothetical protein
MHLSLQGQTYIDVLLPLQTVLAQPSKRVFRASNLDERSIPSIKLRRTPSAASHSTHPVSVPISAVL